MDEDEVDDEVRDLGVGVVEVILDVRRFAYG